MGQTTNASGCADSSSAVHIGCPLHVPRYSSRVQTILNLRMIVEVGSHFTVYLLEVPTASHVSTRRSPRNIPHGCVGYSQCGLLLEDSLVPPRARILWFETQHLRDPCKPCFQRVYVGLRHCRRKLTLDGAEREVCKMARDFKASVEAKRGFCTN